LTLNVIIMVYLRIIAMGRWRVYEKPVFKLTSQCPQPKKKTCPTF